MMKIIKRMLIVVGLLIPVMALAQGASKRLRYELYITFSPNDCINCTIALNQLHRLPESMHKHIVLRTNDKDFFEELTSDNSSLKLTKNLDIIYSDKLYKKHNSLELSTCQLYKGKKLVGVFYLKDLLSQLDVLHALTYEILPENTDTLYLDSLNLSERVVPYRSGNHLYLHDYLLNKIVHANTSELMEGTGRLTTIKPGHVSKGWLMNIAGLDTAVYKGVYPVLRALGKDKIRYEAVYSKGDTLFTLASFSYPEFSGNDTIISGRYYIFKYVKNKLSGTYYINESGLQGGKYYLDNIMPFYADNGKYFLPVYADSLEHGTRMFGEWNTGGHAHQLSFSKFTDHIIPSFFYRHKEIYNGNSAAIYNDLYFYNAYPYIIDLKSSKSFDLGAALEEAENKKLYGARASTAFYLKDVIAKGSMLKLLYFIDKKPKVAFFDTATGKIAAVTTVPVTKNFHLPSMVFLDASTLFVFDSTRKKAYLLK